MLKKIFSFLFSLFLSTLIVLGIVYILIKLDVIHVNFINSNKKKSIDEYINNGLKLDDDSLSLSNRQRG